MVGSGSGFARVFVTFQECDKAGRQVKGPSRGVVWGLGCARRSNSHPRVPEFLSRSRSSRSVPGVPGVLPEFPECLGVPEFEGWGGWGHFT